MHEYSMVRSLLGQVVKIAAENGGGVVKEIRVRCGPLAGVEPLLMKMAFESLRGQWGMDDAELRIVEEPLVADCRGCGDRFEPVKFRFVCPHCGSTDTLVVCGDRTIIESLELDQPMTEQVSGGGIL
jgi:hydrogenase nickel incorporation protein HypA/HybF